MKIRTYTELIRLPTFEERFEYLRLNGEVASLTFGPDRFLNQEFYRSTEWKRTRDQVIVRDLGRDLAMEGYDIASEIIIHHMNPITPYDIIHSTELAFDPEYLITTCFRTHNAIHFGTSDSLPKNPIERRPNDTCPWKN